MNTMFMEDDKEEHTQISLQLYFQLDNLKVLDYTVQILMLIVTQFFTLLVNVIKSSEIG